MHTSILYTLICTRTIPAIHSTMHIAPCAHTRLVMHSNGVGCVTTAAGITICVWVVVVGGVLVSVVVVISDRGMCGVVVVVLVV